ncbi:MAG: serine hydrolase domain-containing protein [Cyclobacteriaceae bacterium]
MITSPKKFNITLWLITTGFIFSGLLWFQFSGTTSENNQAQKFETYFQSLFPASEPGAAVLIKSGDSVIFSAGYGLADLKSGTPVTTGTLFNIGSVSKTFVSNAILKLRDEGKLSLEDSLIKFFPDWVKKEIGQKVKIKHLLTHTSGLPDIRYPYNDSVYYLTAKDAENWAPILKTNSVNFEPGTKFEYSNPAFNALALIVESFEGRWQDYVREQIMIPADMSLSTITDGSHPQTGVAHGYIFSRGAWLEKDYMEEPTFAASGNGGVWSSVDELAAYERALRTGAFLSKQTIDESMEIKTFNGWQDSEPEKIGWSWFIGKTAAGYKTIGHTGSQGGFRANFVMIPEKNLFIVMLSSSPRPLEDYTEQVLRMLENPE